MKSKPFNIGDLVRCKGSDIEGLLGTLIDFRGINFNLEVRQGSPKAPNHGIGEEIEVTLMEIEHFYSQLQTTETSSLAMEVLLMTGV